MAGKKAAENEDRGDGMPQGGEGASRLSRLRGQGGAWLNPALAFLLAVWVTHAILRLFVLFRKDAFGFPFVGKPDWYIFHAVSIDALWIALWSLPFLIVLILCGAAGWRRAGRTVFFLLGLLHAVVLVFTVADHETMRFMGMHLDLSLLSTYGNPAICLMSCCWAACRPSWACTSVFCASGPGPGARIYGPSH
jgi:hypothetical protein